MPILESVAPDSPLSQGDVLKGVRLFFTAVTDGQAKDAPVRDGEQIALVLSRPCNAIRDRCIVVARIESFDDNPPKDADTFDKVLHFLTSLRDGAGSRDCFYLGQMVTGLHTGKKRFRAKLNELYTIEVPPVGEKRDEFIANRRIARLSNEFVRDLHLRVLGAFASLGFDDHAWLSNADLKWLVSEGVKEITSLQAGVDRVEASGREAKTLQTLNELKAKIAPFKAELDGRSDDTLTRDDTREDETLDVREA